MNAPEGGWWRERAACAEPGVLPLVDAAFDSPGSRAAHALREWICPRCPVREQCLAEAMTNPEWGVWGGKTSYWRTQHGGANHHEHGHARTTHQVTL